MTAAEIQASNERRRRLYRWLEGCGRAPGTLMPVGADASFRQYLRASANPGVVVMDAPPEREDCRPFLDVAERLESAGVRVPRRIAVDVDQGFLLLEDLGARTALQAIAAGAEGESLMHEALSVLLRSQARVDVAGLPHYDRALLERELSLFPEWYVGRVLGRSLQAAERRLWDDAVARLVESALAQPVTFVHRDFMLRNLMPAADGLAVIDFQDAVRGPVTYDLASLLRDAFIEWTPEQEAAWLRRYRDAAGECGLPVVEPERFRRDLDWMAAQRHLKVLGIFARLSFRDGKSGYLGEAPRFFRYLRRELAEWPEMSALRHWLAGLEAQACAR